MTGDDGDDGDAAAATAAAGAAPSPTVAADADAAAPGAAGRRPEIGAVRISDVRGTQMAAEVTGTFEVDGEDLGFTAIAFGRIGGQNVGARLGGRTEARLAEMGYDADEAVLALQQMLVRGDVHIPDGIAKETFADR